MRWSGFLKFILGVLSAIALIVGGGAIAARIVIARFAAPPPKPTFPNDNKPAATKPATRPTSATPKPDTPEEAATPKPLPSGAFQARVTQQIGLIVRDSPSLDGAQIGGVDFNAQVTVLETSADGDWQRIRLSNDREGWIKAGNVERAAQ